MSLFNAYINLSGAVDADVVREEKLSRHTGYHIGGPADLFITAHSYAALAKVLEVLTAERVEWVILGRGTKILASDSGYHGCVIVLDDEFSRISIGEGGFVTAGAGAVLSKTIFEASRAKLTGLEFLSGIPGSVGGAVSTNAGTRHEWIGSRIHDFVTLQPGKGMKRYAASDVEWGYRRTTIPTNEIILETTFELTQGDSASIDAASREYLMNNAVSSGSRASCGAVFRDPPGRSASVLIDACGLAGRSSGRARISEEDANRIVNCGGASAADVIALMSLMHNEVQKRFGVDLSCEVKLLGFEA